MSCNIKIPLQRIVDDVAEALSGRYISVDNPFLNEAVLTDTTLRGDITADTEARNALCNIIQTCSITAEELEWLARPQIGELVAVSRSDAFGAVTTVWEALSDVVSWGNIKGDITDQVDFDRLKIPASNVSYKIPAVGGVSRDQESRNTDYISIMDFHDKAKGDDYTDAFYAALNAYPEKGGFKINIPAGVFKVKKPLYLVRRIELCGEGIGSTILDFSEMTERMNAPYNAAIAIAHPLNIRGQAGAEAPNTLIVPESQLVTAGIDAKITNLTIRGQGREHATRFNGIIINAPANLSKVEVTNFSGHGFWLTAGVSNAGYGGGYDYSGIANHSELSYCQAFYNGGDGIRMTGSDANTFYIQQCLLAANSGWGIFDHSLLGGVVIGCEVDSSGVGAYGGSGYDGTAGTPSRTLWLGNYSEGNGSPVHYAVNDRNVILGFTGGGPENMNYFGAVTGSGFLSQKPINIASGDVAAYDIGGTTEFAARLSAGALSLRTYPGQELFKIAAYTRADAAQFVAGDVSAMDIPLSSSSGLSRKGVPNFPQGFTLNPYVKFNSGEGPPTTEQRYPGEIVFNASPTIGEYSFWVCIGAGVPGEWIGVGLIQEPEPTLRKAGSTAERPASPAIGFQYFDTDLGKPIYYNASGVWVDSTGVAV